MTKVLVLEERTYLRSWYVGALISQGCDVTAASDLSDALSKIEATHPDVIVMDVTARVLDRAHDVQQLRLTDSEVPIIANATADFSQASLMPNTSNVYFMQSKDLSEVKEKIENLGWRPVGHRGRRSFCGRVRGPRHINALGMGPGLTFGF